MLQKSITLVSSFFKGHQRTIKAKKNILASLFIKGGSIIIGFSLIPLTLDYLDQTRYGIWITITSFLTWFAFFEIGLGSGLKNKLAEALAKKDYELGKIYLSTTYALLTIIIGIVALIFFVANQYIEWSKVFNTDPNLASELSLLAIVVFGFFFLTFVIKLIGVVLLADQRSAFSNAFGPIGNGLALIAIYFLTRFTDGSLIYLALTFSLAPVLVFIGATIYFYKNDYKAIAPSIRHIDFKYGRDLLSLGVKFFIIQVSALVLFQSSNFIITQFYGPEKVTSFNIAYKYFSVIQMLFTIIVLPYWSAFTEAWFKKDIQWIKRTIRNLLYLWLGMVVLSIIMYLGADFFFRIWIGEEQMKSIVISTPLQISLIVYFLIFSFGGIFNMFINGVNKVTLQTYCLLIGAILFVPVTYVFIEYLKWDIESVMIGSIIANFYSLIIAPLQYFKIINNRSYGIWDK